MLATALIDKLRDLIKQHGDHIVMNEYGYVVDDPEFNDDDGAVFLLSFDESGD